MKRALLFFGAIAAFGLLAGICSAAVNPMQPPGSGGASDSQIAVQNRILLKINGKVITVMDLAKRLDLLLYRQYPQLSDVPLVKYQFYQTNWRPVLDTMIDDELILADAKEKKVEATDGDVREEMEKLFGPDVVLNLHRIDLTYDEAFSLLKEELVVQRMVQMMVRSKATVVQPAEVRKLYEKMSEEGKKDPVWVYQVLTVEAGDLEKGAEALEEAYKLLSEEHRSIENVMAVLSEKTYEPRLNAFNRKESELSGSHKAVLETLIAHHYSRPQLSASKKEKSWLFRLFYLEDKREGSPLAFQEVEKKLSMHLIQEAVAKESVIYVHKLRSHFGVTEDYLAQMIPEGFQPFQIR